MRIPIACTLDAVSARDQVEEWRQLLGGSVAVVERPSPVELHLVLRSDLANLTEVVRLAQREKECCAFFEFALRIEPATVRLVVSVPPEASALLDDLTALLPSPPPAAEVEHGRG